MKLILVSSGLANEEIITALEEMVRKPRQNINVAVINEAIKGESGDMRWFTDELERLSHIIGGKIEFVDLQAHDIKYVKERIATADMIFCFGGNTDYLANVFLKTGFAEILPEILKEKVWVGSSAGSCVMCYKEPDEVQEVIYKEKRMADHFMEYVPIIFLPHLHGCYKFDQAEVIQASEKTDLPVYAVSDNCALKVIDHEEPVILGTDYIIAQKGELK